MNRKRIINLILTILLAVIFIITALFILWWNGLFLPDWIDWKENDIYYEGAKASLKDKKLTVVKDNEVLWTTEKNWYVQDVMVEDINFDGREELVVLLWKHGSFGKHMPMWQSRNDINLKQHIFIYQWDDNRENKLRAVWMSSEIDYQIESIARGGDRRLITNLKNGEHRLWQWQDFGLKLLGPALEHKLDYAAVGDNLLHLNLLNYADGDYDIFYKEITNEIESYDIASVNQETVFVDDLSQISDFHDLERRLRWRIL